MAKWMMEENILHWSILQKHATFGFQVLSRDTLVFLHKGYSKQQQVQMLQKQSFSSSLTGILQNKNLCWLFSFKYLFQGKGEAPSNNWKELEDMSAAPNFHIFTRVPFIYPCQNGKQTK